jgi:hypothetical protein
MRVRDAEQDVETIWASRSGVMTNASNYSVSVGRTIGQSLQEKARLSVGVSSSRGKCDASGVRNTSTNKR